MIYFLLSVDTNPCRFRVFVPSSLGIKATQVPVESAQRHSNELGVMVTFHPQPQPILCISPINHLAR